MLKMSCKELLRATIKELMSKSQLSNISVQDILEYSGVSRSTFYKHFYDKQALMEYTFQKELVEVCFYDYTRTLEMREAEALLYLDANRAFYINAIKEEGFVDLWFKACYESILGYIKHVLTPNTIDDDDMDFVTRFVTYGWVNTNISWLKEKNGQSPEELGRKLSLILEYGIKAFNHTGDARL